MINYLLADWKDRWKYVDDTTTTETIGPDCNSNLQDLVNYIDNWTTSNNMKLREYEINYTSGWAGGKRAETVQVFHDPPH
jgi:hypothetical protein